MKTKIFNVLLGSLILISCNKNEMKISRSDYSIQTDIHDFSPAYITQDKGKVEMNKNNLIGNTHWILLVERNLNLENIASFLQELTEKKHKKGGMHEDTKNLYFIYSDTLHKNNAYVQLPFRKVILKEAENTENVTYLSNSDLVDSLIVTGEKKLSFDKSMNIETFINILIKLEKLGLSEKTSDVVYIY